MTQEGKSLLLKDLCARLPYKVECEAILNNGGNYPCVLNIGTLNQHISGDHVLKPYLRPMSSMTEEENKTIKQLGILCSIKRNVNGNYERIFDGFGNESADTQLKALDWLNAHHFDFRNLIERGLAIDCTGLNVY